MTEHVLIKYDNGTAGYCVTTRQEWINNLERLEVRWNEVDKEIEVWIDEHDYYILDDIEDYLRLITVKNISPEEADSLWRLFADTTDADQTEFYIGEFCHPNDLIDYLRAG